MPILLNGISLHQPWTGIGWYTSLLGEHLHDLDQDVVYWGHASAGSRAVLDHDLNSIEAVRGRRLARLRLLPRLDPMGVYRAVKLRSKPADTIYHETNFIPRTWGFKTVSTIHDLSILRYPEFHPEERVSFMKDRLPEAVRRSDQIIAISSAMKNEIRDILKVPENKISVTHLAARPIFKPRSFSEVANTLEKFNLKHRQFLVMIGSFEPRKNLDLVLGAVNSIADKDFNGFQLVHIGPSGWNNEGTAGLVEGLSDDGRLRQLGYLADSDLAEIVASARALVFPSKYEGFGLPIVEAMASATPVITTNHGAMAEVAGDAARLISGEVEEELAIEIKKIIADDDAFDLLRKAGLQRAKQFSWRDCAEQTIGVYNSL